MLHQENEMENLKTEKSATDCNPNKTPYRLWLIPFCVCLVMFLTMGSERSNSLVLVAIMEEEHVERFGASFPSTARAAATIFFALMSTFLGSRTTFLGLGSLAMFLYVLGRVVCYFSTNLYSLTIFYGFISGGGMVILWTHLPSIINVTLKDNASTGMGIATIGVPLGGFFWPYITQTLLDNYDLKGTFLLTAGISLHGFLGIVLIYKIIRNKNYFKQKKANLKKDKLKKGKAVEIKPNVLDSSSSDKFNSDLRYDQEDSKKNSEVTKTKTENSGIESEDESDCEVQSISQKKLLLRIITSRAFYVLSFTVSLNFFCQTGIDEFLVDFLSDKGIDRQTSLRMLTGFCAGGIVGQLGLGWITDRKYISSRLMTAIDLSVSAIALFSTTWFVQIHLLWTCYFIMGISQASTFVTCWVHYSHYFEEHEIITAMSASRFIMGLVQLSRSPVIGLFRDYLQTYNYFFRGASGLLFLFAGMWLYEEYRANKKLNYSKLKTVDPDDE